MTADESKLEILKKVENGTLSVEEGAELLGILDRAEESKETGRDVDFGVVEDKSPEVVNHEVSGCWKAAWSMILVGGAVLTAFSAIWINQGYQNHGFGWGFWFSWIPFAIGLLITIFGWVLMESPWMQIRVHTKSKTERTNINIAVPVPLKMVGWIVRNFGRYMPDEIHEKGVEEIISEMEFAFSRGETLHVDVNDEENDERVNVYFS